MSTGCIPYNLANVNWTDEKYFNRFNIWNINSSNECKKNKKK